VNNLRTTQISQYHQPVRTVWTKNYSPRFHRKFQPVKKFMFSEIKKAAQAGGLCRCAKITAQDFCGAAAFFALTASFLRLM
jgi:hypothetical protein